MNDGISFYRRYMSVLSTVYHRTRVFRLTDVLCYALSPKCVRYERFSTAGIFRVTSFVLEHLGLTSPHKLVAPGIYRGPG